MSAWRLHHETLTKTQISRFQAMSPTGNYQQFAVFFGNGFLISFIPYLPNDAGAVLALFPAMSTCPTSSSDLHWAACWLVCFSNPHFLPSFCIAITLVCSSRAGDASIVELFKRAAPGRARDLDDKLSIGRDHGLLYEIERSLDT